jgi:uncharacterized protein (DUF302 family)
VTRMNDFGISKKLSRGFSEARERTEAALKTEGFGVLTAIDFQETLKNKLGVTIDKYVILGACHPPSAYKALQADKNIGLFLPCNVIIYEEGSEVVVSLFDPMSVMKEMQNSELLAVAGEVRARFVRVINSL